MRRAIIFVLLAGCNALSGVNDLSAELDDGIGAPDRIVDGGDGSAASSSGGPSSGPDGSSAGDGSGPNPLVDGGGDASNGSTRIRAITFEDEALVHPTSGFDSTIGSVQLVSQGPLAGKHSMGVDGVAAWGTVSFAAVNDLFVTMSLRVDPAGSNTAGDARFLRVTSSGNTVPIEVFVRSSPRDLVVVQGAATVASFGSLLTDGTVYRFEMHVASSGKIGCRLVNGGSAAAAGGSVTFGASSKVEVGALSGGTIRATFDDVLLDSAEQP